jgi:hypothetical protein
VQKSQDYVLACNNQQLSNCTTMIETANFGCQNPTNQEILLFPFPNFEEQREGVCPGFWGGRRADRRSLPTLVSFPARDVRSTDLSESHCSCRNKFRSGINESKKIKSLILCIYACVDLLAVLRKKGYFD